MSGRILSDAARRSTDSCRVGAEMQLLAALAIALAASAAGGQRSPAELLTTIADPFLGGAGSRLETVRVSASALCVYLRGRGDRNDGG